MLASLAFVILYIKAVFAGSTANANFRIVWLGYLFLTVPLLKRQCSAVASTVFNIVVWDQSGSYEVVLNKDIYDQAFSSIGQ